MLTLGDSTTTDQLQFVVPNSEVIVHSTSDGGAAPSGAAMSWPVYNGRDMSWYSGWTGYLGFFISTEHGFVGMYDHGRDQGIVRAHSPNWPSGAKIFGPGTLSPDLWTDDGSRYVELWSGATGSFWHYVDLEPGQTVGWTEVWYPVNGMGGFNAANQRAVLKLQHTGVGLDIAIAVSSYVNGEAVLLQNGAEVGRWPLQIGPGQAFRTTWPVAFEESTQFGLQLINGDGSLVAQVGNIP